MQFSTKEKNYADSQQSSRLRSQAPTEPTANNSASMQNTYQGKSPDRKQTNEAKRPSLIQTPKNEQLFQAFPQLNINRVDSSEHRQKLKLNTPHGSSYLGLTNSMIDRPTNRGDTRITSTSVEKGNNTNYYLNTKNDMYSSSQYGLNKPSYLLNYATYKRDTYLVPHYGGQKSDDGSQEGPIYKKGQNTLTLQRMGMQINPKMVSSVISRESNGKQNSHEKLHPRVYQSSSSKNKDSKNGEADEPYEHLYASRHPNQSIRKSTIQISKAISNNAITELQRLNQNQQKKIKVLQRELDDIKGSLKKYDQIKHRYQMDLQAKSRQIFDLQRVNKRLSEEVQGIRAYRTMDTVEQVIIVKLKQEIMQLNKKIIEMQAEHYKNQKMFLQKHKKDGSKAETDSDKQTVRKLEQSLVITKKQSELLSVQLQKEKQKSWNLQRQKQQQRAKQSIEKQSNDKQLQFLKKQLNSTKIEVQRQVQNLKSKQFSFQQKIKQLNRNFDNEIAQRVGLKDKEMQTKITQKQQQFKAKLNEEMKLYESKLVEQGKNSNSQQINRMKSQKQQVQSQLKLKTKQLQKLWQASKQNTNYIKTLEKENKQILDAVQVKSFEIQSLKSQNLKIIQDMSRQLSSKAKWKQQETYLIQQNIKLKFEQQIKIKQKQLEAKAVSIHALEKTINQTRNKLQEQKKMIAAKAQSQLMQKQQKMKAQLKQKQQGSIRELESTKKQLEAETSRIQSNLNNLKKQLSGITTKKAQAQSQLSVKLKQFKQYELKTNDIQSQISNKSRQISQLQNKKKALLVESQKSREQNEKQKTNAKQLQLRLNSATAEIGQMKTQSAKLQQKSKQLQLQLNRALENTNVWKSKSEKLQSAIQKQRLDFKQKITQSQESKVKVQIVKKYQELLPEYELVKQKLKIKQEEISNREGAFIKIKQHSESGQLKATNLMKQIRVLTGKVDETQTKFKNILVKVQAQQSKYRELVDKLTNDSHVYLMFIKKLQEQNELIAQKYWKIRKLVKKQKINDQNDLLDKHDYSTFKKYIQHDLLNNLRKVTIPAFEAKIAQKISTIESSLGSKVKRLGQLKALVQYAKRKKQSQKSKIKS